MRFKSNGDKPFMREGLSREHALRPILLNEALLPHLSNDVYFTLCNRDML